MSAPRLGQHFLTNATWRARIVEELARSRDDVWVEIGAGHGEMTRELAGNARRVLAIELDPRLVERLREATRDLPAVEVLAGDVLELDLPAVAGSRFKVYGNLPYYISSPILRQLFQWASHIDLMALVVQLEVAERLVAQPGRRDYGYLSVLTQLYMQPEIALRIPPGAFRPPPKVFSGLVRMRPHAESRVAELAIDDQERFLRFVQACFAQKRKTLLNNLRAMLPASTAEELVQTAELPLDVRAEQLSVQQFARLFCVRESWKPAEG